MIPQEEMYALGMSRLDLYSIITFLKGLLREENEGQVCEWGEHEQTMLLALFTPSKLKFHSSSRD